MSVNQSVLMVTQSDEMIRSVLKQQVEIKVSQQQVGLLTQQLLLHLQ